MTYFDDLSPYTYGRRATGKVAARNIGWLAAGRDFPTEQSGPDLLEALWEFCSLIVLPMRGLHPCEFCASPSHTFVRHGTRRLLGSGEIRVFGSTGAVFAAPNLVYHYVVEHHYRPPQEFLRAIEDGPRPGSDEYRLLMQQLEVDWRENTPVQEEPLRFRFVRTENGVERKEVKGRG